MKEKRKKELRKRRANDGEREESKWRSKELHT